MLQDIVLILVMSVPMLMFSVYPGIRLGDYLQEKYELQEKQKIIISVATTLIFAVTLSSLLHFI
ncbi:MAG TPA: hypothetical protein VIM82_07160 [Sulfurimonas sp.]|jgi:hypothetical protein